MKSKLVKDVMIPIENYVAVKKEDTIFDLFQALEASKTADQAHAHRDAIVMDDNGEFYGKVTMLGIFKALEPKYRQIDEEAIIKAGHGRITHEILDAYKSMDFWVEPSKSICERGSSSTIADAIHVPEDNEFIQEDDTIEKALHLYVMGADQPLVVKDGDKVTGLLRFGDIFEVLRQHLLTCEF